MNYYYYFPAQTSFYGFVLLLFLLFVSFCIVFNFLDKLRVHALELSVTFPLTSVISITMSCVCAGGQWADLVTCH